MDLVYPPQHSKKETVVSCTIVIILFPKVIVLNFPAMFFNSLQTKVCQQSSIQTLIYELELSATLLFFLNLRGSWWLEAPFPKLSKLGDFSYFLPSTMILHIENQMGGKAAWTKASRRFRLDPHVSHGDPAIAKIQRVPKVFVTSLQIMFLVSYIFK